MQIVIPDHTYTQYYPLSQTRPVWDLFYGMCAAHERMESLIRRSFPDVPVIYHVRKELLGYAQECYSDKTVVSTIPREDTLFLSPLLTALDGITADKRNCVYETEGAFCAAFLSADRAVHYDGEASFFSSSTQHREELGCTGPAAYLWDIVRENGRYIRQDWAAHTAGRAASCPESLAVRGNRADCFIEENVRIDPYVVIDTTNGPVYIAHNCEIHPFSRIEGPCYIGPGSVILGAKIREGCSFGAGCRIGGEIEDSILYPRVNKYHDGFIGHACIGSWVNLGALTTNSDLKNDYTTVTVYTPDGVVDTGERKVGCFIGDHVKCSIGTLINTGTVIGAFAMSVHSGYMAREHIPPFSLYIKNTLRDGPPVDTLINTAETVMSRRNITMGHGYRKYIRELYASLTTQNRMS